MGHLHSPWLAGALDLHVAGGGSLREVHSCWVLFLWGEKKLQRNLWGTGMLFQMTKKKWETLLRCLPFPESLLSFQCARHLYSMWHRGALAMIIHISASCAHWCCGSRSFHCYMASKLPLYQLPSINMLQNNFVLVSPVYSPKVL